ncbi:hypothetical protein, partial [Holdemanella porci]|uniref:hypothetical protein n=1 Tax=Holdemanella porci TaxID=2652276 RepID=UPI003FD8091B
SRRNLRMKQDKNHFLVILAIYFLIFLTMAESPYVIVSGEENSLSHILFFESLMTTNLIVPFALNTIYLVYLLFKTILSQDN